MTAFPAVFGKFYKYVNNKYVYLACILIFEVGSLIDALAPNSPLFIFGRCLSGLGAAGLMQGALQIILLGVELEKRAAAQGFVVSVFGLAVCFGPPLGGAFTDGIVSSLESSMHIFTYLRNVLFSNTSHTCTGLAMVLLD